MDVSICDIQINNRTIMARTPKIKRRWIKEEKQIVYLLYRKGLLEDFKIKDLYWAEYHWRNRKHYRSSGGYRWPVYMPEVHFWTTDYWGEGDEHSVVDAIIQDLYWQNIDTTNWDSESGEYPPSKFRRMERGQFIKYLKKLPTKIGDRKINKLLKKVNIYD